MIDKTVIKELDLEKYLGKCYEIGRFDHSYERGSVGVTATYSYRKDGKTKVENTGNKGTLDGLKLMAVAKAKITNRTKPSKLKVSFFGIFYAN